MTATHLLIAALTGAGNAQDLSEQLFYESQRAELLQIQVEIKRHREELSGTETVPELVGIRNTDDGSLMAIFRIASDSGDVLIQAYAGDPISDQWKIDSVSSNSVVLRGIGAFNRDQTKLAAFGSSPKNQRGVINPGRPLPPPEVR